MAQAGLEVGRLRLEGRGARKLTAGEGSRDEARSPWRGKPCRLQGLKGWEETSGVGARGAGVPVVGVKGSGRGTLECRISEIESSREIQGVAT